MQWRHRRRRRRRRRRHRGRRRAEAQVPARGKCASPGSGSNKGAAGAWEPAHAQPGPLGCGTVSAGNSAPRTGTVGGRAARSAAAARPSPRSPNRLPAGDALLLPRPSRGGFLGTPGRARLRAETAAVRRAGPGSGTFTPRRLPKLQLPAGPAPPRPRRARGPVGSGRQRLLELGRWRWFPCGRSLPEGRSPSVFT